MVSQTPGVIIGRSKSKNPAEATMVTNRLTEGRRSTIFPAQPIAQGHGDQKCADDATPDKDTAAEIRGNLRSGNDLETHHDNPAGEHQGEESGEGSRFFA